MFFNVALLYPFHNFLFDLGLFVGLESEDPLLSLSTYDTIVLERA